MLLFCYFTKHVFPCVTRHPRDPPLHTTKYEVSCIRGLTVSVSAFEYYTHVPVLVHNLFVISFLSLSVVPLSYCFFSVALMH